MRRFSMLVGALLLALTLAACGGDDDADTPSAANESSSDADTTGDDAGAETSEPAGEEATNGGGGGGGGTVVLGDETIVLDSARCFLQEQDAAAGGGKILFVGQGFGVNAAGEEVVVDVSRYDEESQFTGDDILVDIGDFETGVSWAVTADLGTVQIDGNTMSAEGLTLTNFDDFSEVSGSFTLNC